MEKLSLVILNKRNLFIFCLYGIYLWCIYSHINFTWIWFIVLSLYVFSLFACGITEKQCLILTSALKIKPITPERTEPEWESNKKQRRESLMWRTEDSRCKLEILMSVTFTHKNQNDENHFNSLNQTTLYSVSHDEWVHGFTLYLWKILHINDLFVRWSLFLCLSLLVFMNVALQMFSS